MQELCRALLLFEHLIHTNDGTRKHEVSADSQLPVNIKAAFIATTTRHIVLNHCLRLANCLKPNTNTCWSHQSKSLRCLPCLHVLQTQHLQCLPIATPYLPTVMAHLFSCCYINQSCRLCLSFFAAPRQSRNGTPSQRCPVYSAKTAY